LLCHGFSGTPWSLRAWAEHLVADGFRVSLPLLPGHGTSWQELNTKRWPEWYSALETEFLALQQVCDRVFVGGLSVGGALALRLAEQHPGIAGVVLVNPSLGTREMIYRAMPVLVRVLRSWPGVTDDIAKPGVSEFGYARAPLKAGASVQQLWADVCARLPRVTQPILLFRSLADHVVDPTSVQLLHQLVGSADVTERPLHRSFHVATLDYDAEDIFDESSDFIRRHSQRSADD
jgi:carboxylesterase